MIATRIRGVRVVLDRHQTGIGITCWAGEFRGEDDRPLWVLDNPTASEAHQHYPVRFGLEVDTVVAALDKVQRSALTEPRMPQQRHPERSLAAVTRALMESAT